MRPRRPLLLFPAAQLQLRHPLLLLTLRLRTLATATPRVTLHTRTTTTRTTQATRRTEVRSGHDSLAPLLTDTVPPTAAGLLGIHLILSLTSLRSKTTKFQS